MTKPFDSKNTERRSGPFRFLLFFVFSLSLLPFYRGAEGNPLPTKVVAAAIPLNPAPSPTQNEEKTKYLWDFKTELGLSNDQVAKLQGIYDENKKALQGLRANLETGKKESRKLIDQNADLSVIRTQLMANAKILVEVEMANIEKSRKIRQILTPLQLSKWFKIQEDVREKGKTK